MVCSPKKEETMKTQEEIKPIGINFAKKIQKIMKSNLIEIIKGNRLALYILIFR